MEPRQLGRIMRLSIPGRLEAITSGLDVLVEHVEALSNDLSFLEDAGRSRSGASIGIQAEEEAAKVLILLDLVRMGWRSQKACNAQIARFYDHLARGIYAEVCHMRPASFKELKQIVDRARRSHYLDGPNDVDWILRNEIKTRREDSLYVDYVGLEGGDEWVTPASRDGYGTAWRAAAPKLVLALARSGVTTRESLGVVARQWRGVVIDESTNWQVAAGRNRLILDELRVRGLVSDAATAKDLHSVLDEWTFPMAGLQMSEIAVPASDLEAQRERWLDSQW